MVNNIFSHPTFHGQMKKLITLMFLGCFAATTMFGQLNISASFPNPAPGATTTVDFTVTGFTDIVSSQFTLNYDPAVLQYGSISYTNPAFSGLSAAAFGNPNPGVITFSWFDNSLSGVTVADGTLMFSIDFVAIGADGTNSAITFGNSPTPIEFSDNNFQTLPPGDFTLTDGNVPVGSGGGGNNGPLGTSFACPTGATGENVCIDVAVTDFELIQGFQYTVAFDPAVLQYTGTAGYNLVDLTAGNFGDGSGGLLTVSWNQITNAGTGVTVADGTVIYQICFNVIGAGGTSSTISTTNSPTAQEAYHIDSPGTNIGLNGTPCTFSTSGTGGSALSIQAGTVSGEPNSTVCVPYTVTNFTDIVSMQYVMNYDNSVLQFNSVMNINAGITGMTPSSFNSSNPGTINFSWFDNTIQGVTVPNGTVAYEICFDVIGTLGDSSPLSYSGLIEASQNQGGSTTTVPLTTLPGSVSVVGAPGANFTIDAAEVNSDGATNVCVPFTVLNFSTIISMEFDMTYDPTHLEYTGVNVTGALPGLQPTTNFNLLSPGNLRLASWTSPDLTVGETLADGTSIFEVCFDKLGTTGTSSIISFNLNGVNEIAIPPGTALTLKDFLDGSVTCTTGSQPLDVTSVAPVVTQIDCNGNTTGAIDVTTSGGVAPITYSWVGSSETTEDLTNLGPGTYTLTAMDGTGATASTSAIVINAAPGAITTTDVVTDEMSAGANDGAINLTTAGGTAPYAWSWDNTPAGTTEDISGLAPGNYNVTVTDANMCTMTFGPFTVAPFMAALTIDPTTSTVVDIECFGEMTGSITLAVTGGATPYSYSWSSNGATSNPLLNIGAGNYSVTVTDSAGATATETFTVNELATAALDCSVANITDAMGGNNGAIDLVPSGGTTPYSYNWSNGQTTEDISSLGAGLYIVTITDDNGCTQICSHTVNQADPFDIDETLSTVTNATCLGINNGAINLAISGGTMPYGPFSWTGPNGYMATTQNIAALVAGTYNVTATDASGATDMASFTITEPATAITVVTTSFSDESGQNANDGSVTVSASGGSSPYSFLWSNNASDSNTTTSTISGLTGGLYCVTVTDATGVCTEQICQTVNTIVPNPMVLTFTVSNPACNGGDGGISVEVTGGTPNYTYMWEETGVGPIPNNAFPNLGGIDVGTYGLTVTDANGVQAFGSQTLVEPAALVLSAVPTSSSGTDGSIELDIFGGSPAYTPISWTGPAGFMASTEDISGLAPGQYCVEVFDANGCTANSCYDVTATANPPVVTIAGTNLTCNGDNTGAITLNVSGGVGTPTFTWNPDLGNTQNPSGLAAGTYEVTVSDDNNDTAIASITITEPAAIMTTGQTTPVTNGMMNGAINIVVSGGSGMGYTYSWTGPAPFTANTQNISGLAAGQYIVNIEDSNGCTTTGIYNVIEDSNVAPVVIMANMIPADCNDENGAITVGITAGTGNPAFTYNWSVPGGGPNGPTITGLSAGSYDVTVTDAQGLTGVLQGIMVTAATNGTSIPATGVTVTCESGSLNDGQVNITPTGGCLPYTFLWSNGGTTEDITGLIANDYRVTITDDCGCIFVSDDYTVCFDGGSVSPAIVIEEPLCNGDANGSIILSVDTPGDYSFAWTGTSSSGPSATGLAAGTYSVTITDDNNNNAVVYMNTWTLGEPDAIVITVDDVQHQGCPPGPGAIYISVTGGTFPVGVSWSSGATSQDLNPAAVGFHQPTAIDANGCFLVGPDIEVTDDPPCAVEEMITPVNCSNECDGSIDINVVGGTPGYTFLWSNGDTSEDVAGLCEGAISVTITDASGLVNSHTYVVGSNNNGPQLSGTVLPSSGSDGMIDVSVSLGSPAFTFIWSNGATTEDISNLAPGNYSVTVTDANGCTDTESYNVESTLIAAEVTHVDCLGNMNGAIDISPAGSLIPPLTYQWSGPNTMDTTQDITNLEPGVYTVQITDGNGTIATSSWTITEGSDINISTSEINPPSDAGASDANATAIATNGAEPYSYLWSNGQTTQNLTNVSAGLYTVTITDANGCAAENSITIFDPVIFSAALDIVNTSCNNLDCNATATVVINGNPIPPLTYEWSDGQTTQTAVGLCDTVYTVIVTDADGNSTMAIASNFGVEEMTASYVTSDLGGNLYEIIINVEGGTAPYQYVWGNPLADNDDNTAEASPGTYAAIIMDANGCTVTLDQIFVYDDTECLDYRQVITPNDDGFNDNFEMSCLERYPNNELEIYSRWGELMWMADGDYNNQWEGTDLDGKLLPQGGYFFVFRYDDDTSGTVERKQIKGAITLLR